MSAASRIACFVPVRRHFVVSGITSGIVAASATSGALVGFGIRLGTLARVFNAIASIVLGPEAFAVYGYAASPTLVGVLLHVCAMIVCGLVYVLLVTISGGRDIAWALVLSAVLAAALVIGMRLAQVRVYKD